jgi:hypothetical protein
MNERFYFRCPSTDQQTDAFCEKVDGPAESRHWNTIRCHACARIHVVDARTGDVVATHEEVRHAPDAGRSGNAPIV